jgi:hypothetical protein
MNALDDFPKSSAIPSEIGHFLKARQNVEI